MYMLNSENTAWADGNKMIVLFLAGHFHCYWLFRSIILLFWRPGLGAWDPSPAIALGTTPKNLWRFPLLNYTDSELI